MSTETSPRRRIPVALAASLFCLLFFAEGLLFIPCFGLQNDETIFSGAIYPPPGALDSIRIFGPVHFPSMLMTYLGTLKAWLWLPILEAFGPSAWSVRVPALLAGALTVWLLFALVRRIAGVRAALTTAALLATDAVFVLTTCMDWGPVVLQHLLLVSGLLLLLRFHQTGQERLLAAGFFLFGLALWDKALFSWSLAGLAVASVAVFPRQLRSRLTRRNILIAVISILVGAAPLVSYNISHGFETFRGNTHFSTEGFSQKTALLRITLAGTCLNGYMVRTDPPPEPGRPSDALEAVAVRVNDQLEPGLESLFPYACLLALLLLPLLWRTPARGPMLFSLIFMAVVWLQMAFTKGAGTGAHHTVLLWPFPHLFAGVALAEGSRKLGRAGLPVLMAVALTVCGSSLIVLDQYLGQLVENGPTAIWTDAINPLSAYLRTCKARRIYVVDWGMMNSLRILNAGALPLDLAAESGVSVPDAVFIAHTPGNEIFQGVNSRMDDLARSAGERKETLKVIDDRHDRPIFQVYRYVPAGENRASVPTPPTSD